MSNVPVANPLSAPSLAQTIAKSLPPDASPQLKTPIEAIALAVHAGMLNVGFTLKAFGEQKIESQATEPQPLPSSWNASSSFDFRYSHPQSSMEYILKVHQMGSKVFIDGLAIGDDKRASFELVANDYISPGNLPATPVAGQVNDGSAKTIENIFISSGRLSDLGSLLKVSIIQKLAPSLQKEGYEESQTESLREQQNSRESQRPPHDPLRHDAPPARPRPFGDTGLEPRRPFPDGLEPPGFEDEHDILRGPRGGMPGGRNPLGIGHDDLYPPGMGPNDPFRPSFSPGLGGRGGGGMHPTFDDPLFGGHGEEGIRGDPRAPGGARYDPVYPGDPRGGPGRFPGAGHRGPSGAPHNPFGGFGDGDFI
ncbi:PI31 proteasome regulator [Venturia nashicola]|nr:PI31 proteasome regulator [Venturia nashicola]